MFFMLFSILHFEVSCGTLALPILVAPRDENDNEVLLGRPVWSDSDASKLVGNSREGAQTIFSYC